MRQGVALFVSGLAALIGPPISGALLSADGGDFRYAIIFSGTQEIILLLSVTDILLKAVLWPSGRRSSHGRAC